jgi:hypothetical protein
MKNFWSSLCIEILKLFDDFFLKIRKKIKTYRGLNFYEININEFCKDKNIWLSYLEIFSFFFFNPKDASLTGPPDMGMYK